MPRKHELLNLDLGLDTEPEFHPYNISREGQALLFKDVPESVKHYARTLRDVAGWKFYAVDQDRGRCYYRAKVITIPMWVITKRSIGEKIWYISHELSHAYAGPSAMHGDKFMQKLIEICPEEHVHFELGYKPRNAARNGITLL